MTTDSCAVICPSGPLKGSSLSAVLDTAGVSLSDTTVITGAPPSTAGVHYGKVIVIGLQNPPLTVKEVQAACTHLKSGGQLLVLVPSSQDSVRRLVVMSGCTSASTTTVNVEGSSCGMTSATKPGVSLGAKTSIASAELASTWKITVDAAHDDLIDDDELLTEEDRKPVEPPKNDCSTSKKACANCSCGRAEAEAAGVKLQLTPDMIENPQSACGSCSLGDAFRCATCPYRGLPIFQPGKKIELPSDFLLADA
eukprot:jgi/Ulvmu1/8883/UM049_0065.1